MISNNLQQFHIIKQGRQEARFTMEGYSLTKLIHKLIREYGTYNRGDYHVDLRDFETIDKKLILSHLLEACEYEEVCQFPALLEEEFWTRRSFIEKLIDENTYEVYQDDQEDARYYK